MSIVYHNNQTTKRDYIMINEYVIKNVRAGKAVCFCGIVRKRHDEQGRTLIQTAKGGYFYIDTTNQFKPYVNSRVTVICDTKIGIKITTPQDNFVPITPDMYAYAMQEKSILGDAIQKAPSK